MSAVAERPTLLSLLKTVQTNSLEGFEEARRVFFKNLRNYSKSLGKVLALQHFREILGACLRVQPP